jgi:MOSC domain-containing protein YiiM
MSGDRYPAALWLAARFLFEPSAAELNVSDPDDILARVGVEIEDEIKRMLHGGKSDAVTAMCCGAAAVRRHAPATQEWIGRTALLRSPCARREYDKACDFVDERQDMIGRVARVLSREGKLSAAEALWIADEPPYRLAS